LYHADKTKTKTPNQTQHINMWECKDTISLLLHYCSEISLIIPEWWNFDDF